MTRKAKTYFIVIGTAVIALIGVPAWFIFGPPRRLVISTETTHLTEPLTADGQVDYVQATINRQREGVTRENNAVIPLLQATWPCEMEPHDQQLVCDELGIAPPQTDGLRELYRDDRCQEQITAWASEKWGLDLNDEDQHDFDADQYVEDASWQPWTREQIPPLAAWIDEHADSFAMLHQIEGRDHYFFPSPKLYDADRSLNTSVGPDANILRTAARALSTRAMLHIGEGEPRLAWRDLRLLFVLTRLPCVERQLVYALVACAIDGVACQGLEQLLNSRQCDGALLDEIEQFFAALPPIADIASIVDQHERWMLLEMSAANGEDDWLEYVSLYLDSDEPQGPKWLLGLPIDRNAMLQRLNERLDEMVTILAMPDPLPMKQAGEQFDDQLSIAVAQWNELGPTAAATISQSVRGIYAGDLAANWLITAYTQAKLAQFRTETNERMVRVAVALERFRVAKGEYPNKLAQISERLDLALLEDPYAGRPLRYERRGEGYLLLSVFENGVDDGGDSIDGTILDGDWVSEAEQRSNWPDVDIVLRFPKPPLVLTKPKTRAEVEAEFELLFGEEEWDGLESEAPE